MLELGILGLAVRHISYQAGFKCVRSRLGSHKSTLGRSRLKRREVASTGPIVVEQSQSLMPPQPQIFYQLAAQLRPFRDNRAQSRKYGRLVGVQKFPQRFELAESLYWPHLLGRAGLLLVGSI